VSSMFQALPNLGLVSLTWTRADAPEHRAYHRVDVINPVNGEISRRFLPDPISVLLGHVDMERLRQMRESESLSSGPSFCTDWSRRSRLSRLPDSLAIRYCGVRTPIRFARRNEIGYRVIAIRCLREASRHPTLQIHHVQITTITLAWRASLAGTSRSSPLVNYRRRRVEAQPPEDPPPERFFS
jgi:hypothetical protein